MLRNENRNGSAAAVPQPHKSAVTLHHGVVRESDLGQACPDGPSLSRSPLPLLLLEFRGFGQSLPLPRTRIHTLTHMHKDKEETSFFLLLFLLDPLILSSQCTSVNLRPFASAGATPNSSQDENKAPPPQKQNSPQEEEEEDSSGEESIGDGALHSTPQVAAAPSPAGLASYAASSARASPANASPEVCARTYVRVGCRCAVMHARVQVLRV